MRGVSHIDLITITSNERLSVLIIAKTLQVIIFYLLVKRKKQHELRNIISPMPMLICFTIPLISLIITVGIHVLVLGGLHIPENVVFIVSVGLLAINIMVFVLYEFINREAEKNYALIAKTKQYALTEEHNNQVIEIYDKMRE